MTAINIMLRPDRAVVFTDGAGLSSEGVLQFACTKILLMPQYPAALAVLGSNEALTTLYHAVEGAGASSFDDLAGRFGAIVRRAFDAMADAGMTHILGGHVEAFLIGWSQAENGPDAVGVSSITTMRDPFTPLRLAQVTAPSGPALAAYLNAAGIDAGDPAHAVRLMQAQRAMRPPRAAGGPMFHMVGCFIQETVITRAAITTRIVHRWQDEIGKPINP